MTTRAPLDDLPDGCPFCGGEATGEIINRDHYQTGYILCRDCGCRTMPFSTKKEAIAAWNRRSSTPTIDLQTLKEEISRKFNVPTREYDGAFMCEIVDYLAARGLICSTPTAKPGDEWQAIESAPKDKQVLIWGPGCQ